MTKDKWHPKTIKCQYCDKNLYIQNIKQHEKSCNLNLENKYKIYKCEYCGKNYIINDINTVRFCSKTCSRTYSNSKIDHTKTTKKQFV